MSLFKRRRTNRKGVLTEDAAWTIEFVDHHNITRRLTAFRDKTATKTLENNLNRLVAFRASGGVPDLQLNRFIETLPPTICDKLAVWNIIESQLAASKKLITEHIQAWETALKANGVTESYIKTSVSRVGRIASDCKWTHLSDISATSFNTWQVNAKAGGLSI